MIHLPPHTLMVLQLADDLDVFAFLTQYFPDSVNISSFTDEGGKDHVNTLLHTKLQVLNVLLRHSRQVDCSSRQVDTLLAAEDTAILNLTHQVVVAFGHTKQRATDFYKQVKKTLCTKRKETNMCMLTNFCNLEGNQAIVNIDMKSCLHNFGDILVVEPQNTLITFLLVFVVKCDLDGFTFLQLNLSGATLNNNSLFILRFTIALQKFM